MNKSRLRMIGLIAVVLAILGGFFDPSALLQAWHFAVVGLIQVTLGSLFLLMLFQATGGRWGRSLKPVLLAINSLVPLSLLLLIPVLIFLPAVYPWVDDPASVGDRVIFLNRGFFTLRVVAYLIIFGGLSRLIAHGRRPASGGLVLFSLVGYFLSIDLVMAIAPSWFSSGFPVVYMCSSVYIALALAVAIRCGWTPAQDSTGKAADAASDESAANSVPNPDGPVWRDLGNLLLCLALLWSYVSFTQFLIIWMGNLPKEILWYIKRSQGGWLVLPMVLALFNFFVPFFILLSRAIKDHPRRLQRVALGILIAQMLYLNWLLAPSFPGRAHDGLHWLDPVVLIVLASAVALLLRRRLTSNSSKPAKP